MRHRSAAVAAAAAMAMAMALEQAQEIDVRRDFWYAVVCLFSKAQVGTAIALYL